MAQLPDQPKLADFQTFIQKTCEERGWDKRTSLEKMLFLTEEVGELAKAVRKEYGQYGYDKPADISHLAEELVDVFNYLLDLANVYDVDLEAAFRSKWQTNQDRSWTGDYGKAK
ncbi:MAG TPA: MazG nucleotide pyrophosphohydrolase domain-containing protein [Candidatus Saccharimonadales bacterium]|nr:MazG nucleotide pyrophosphohydrolase domain-containing protein [Candidatus Saccharimonadales bacterium]